MKYFILLGDGMADLPVQELNNMTPLEYATKPNMDRLAQGGVCGLVKTVPDHMDPGSGPANMSVMGYDPNVYYTGRAPLEALSLGLPMAADDMVFRCNLVSFSLDGKTPLAADVAFYTQRDHFDETYKSMYMLDYSAGEISSEEAKQLIEALEEGLSCEDLHFYPGKSYRHCVIWNKGPGSTTLIAPHDITRQNIAPSLPQGEGAERLLELMEKSSQILKDHPVNLLRRQKGLNTADSIWLWGQGTKPGMADFTQTYGKKGGVISAVDLLFGLGCSSGLQVIEVEGSTGNLHTNYSGKALAAMDAFSHSLDYIYLHVEAPDECGHQGDIAGKVLSIEKIDQLILAPVWNYLEDNRLETGEDYRIMVLPDHPTPLTTRTHSHDPVPFILYSSADVKSCDGNLSTLTTCQYNEKEATTTGIYYPTGPDLFHDFIKTEEEA